GPSTTSSTMPAPSRCRSIHCCRRATPRSDASPAPAPSPREKIPAPDAGRERTKQNADSTHEHRQHQHRHPTHRRQAPHRTVDPTSMPTPPLHDRPRTGPPSLDVLQSEAIHIIREVAAEFESPVLLFSGGKVSVTVLHLAAKAFWQAKIPFALLHVDTGHNFPEIIRFRDETAQRFGLDLTVAKVQDYIDDGRLRERPDGTRNTLQTQPLIDAIAAGGFDAVFGGARRDEDKARAKERIISLRDEFG